MVTMEGARIYKEWNFSGKKLAHVRFATTPILTTVLKSLANANLERVDETLNS